ncbi:MAG: GNAT family N-acetyltransferase [Saprospiraceae bacterium]|nr:GNAT family N-acetyltransferase [Saprospiraceae bacterium]MBK8633723.1 GNAT family N-acetyltransferase [Saprospiraceae bacterium]MBP7641875.1 GNAT family N-acetyltransferase [Saprospiraceae bacterium]
MNKFRLRPWQLDDLDSLVKNANDLSIAKFMTNEFPNPYTPEAGRRFINFATSDDPIHIFAIDVDGEAVGGIGLHPQRDIMIKNAELGYWLGTAYHGRGIATAAVREMVNFGFKTYDITRIFARPFGSNIASQKVLEKVGFSLEATIKGNIYKFGNIDDELIYAIRK